MIRYEIRDISSYVGGRVETTERLRSDAAAQELWRVVRAALADNGMLDTRRAWELHHQWCDVWDNLRKPLKPGHCVQVTFTITSTRSVQLYAYRVYK